MTKQENGTYTYEVKTDQNEVRYQLLEIEKNGRTVNGTDGTAFFPDSSGDYHSVVTVTNGKAVIVFDPAKLYRRSSERKVAFKNSRQDEKIFEVYAVHEKTERNAGKALSEYAKVNKDLRGFHIDGGKFLQDLPKNIDAEKDRDVKDALKLAYLSFGRFRPLGYDNGKAKTYFESLAPSNPMWDLLPGGFSILQTVVPQFQWDEVQDKFLAECPSMQIRTIIIANKLSSAKFAGNESELKRWHAIIATEYKDVPDMQRLAKMFPAETKIKAGVEIPDYELASMNPSEESYSKKKMLGKIYLIDFWATWCGPCVGEMERLHAAYEKFKDKGFDIISISMDAKLEDVQRFRTDKWKMPWKHSFIGTNRESKIIGDFEVIGIPKPVLVSAEGKVLALESDVRGESLEKTLEKYFK
ncbi:MAG: TlpA family protein disulfide reductase [Acidobacteriota bacterium]